MYGPDFDPRSRGRFEGHSPEGLEDEGFGRRGRGRHHGPGRGGPHGRGPGRPGRGRRARRGDIRQAILLLLEEEPRNGYGLMQEVEDRSGGIWRPSPGSVYPALSQLEDEGLVEMSEAEGRKDFSLTDAGRTWVEEHREEIGTPWDQAGRGAPRELGSLRKSTQALAMAARQLAHTGTPAQLKEAGEILDEARRKLYGILASDPEDENGES
ncbi:MAG: PadR family transcriptional regulator [Solirubrobacterales bacterium]|nr:PadR family transcriptional regulator [Solirubrobacterales bacterium]